MICLRDLGASIQIDGNKGFLIMGWQCLFVDVTPCLALEKNKRSSNFAIFEAISRPGKEYWGRSDMI